jgi:hypothetical protein
LFQKQIYSIFFGTKAAARKLSILKERWFDIANLAAAFLRLTSCKDDKGAIKKFFPVPNGAVNYLHHSDVS